jgi:hypothetical protein
MDFVDRLHACHLYRRPGAPRQTGIAPSEPADTREGSATPGVALE